MNKKYKRTTRPKPARTAPIRDFSTLLQGAEQPRAAESPGARPASGDPLADAVTQGARLGYSVIEEQLRQGRRIAQQLTQVAAGGRGSGRDVDQIMQRVLHFSTDFGAMLVDFAALVMRMPAGGAARGASGANVASGAAEQRNGSGAHLSVEVEARGRSKVTLDLDASAVNGSRLVVPALYSLDGRSAPLTQISFDSHTLHVRIPDEQPTGTYTGVVVDGETNHPKGTLSVVLTG